MSIAGCVVGPSRNLDMVTAYLQRQARKVLSGIRRALGHRDEEPSLNANEDADTQQQRGEKHVPASCDPFTQPRCVMSIPCSCWNGPGLDRGHQSADYVPVSCRANASPCYATTRNAGLHISSPTSCHSRQAGPAGSSLGVRRACDANRARPVDIRQLLPS